MVAAALILASGVALGALGAHALKKVLDEEALNAYDTAVRYQLLHGLALLVLKSLQNKMHALRLKWASMLMLFGIILFSGSIYLLSLRELLGLGNWIEFIGPMTPLGGVAMISAWIIAAFAFLKPTKC